MNTAVCLQVRLDSSRLPGKALMKIEDLTIVEHAMRALSAISADRFLLLTTEDSEEKLAPLALKWGFTVISGPKDDVLARFLLAAERYNLTTVIRATGDNPLVSAQMANEVLKDHRAGNFEYSNWTDAPLGTGIEIVEAQALRLAADSTDDPYDREHVTPWIYNNPDKFRLNIRRVPDRYFFKCKVSVDTPGDLENMKVIFSRLYKGKPVEIDELIGYLRGILLIPSTKAGNGTGHMKRMIALAENFKGNSRIYIDKNNLDRVLPVIPEPLRNLIISDMGNPQNYTFIVLDNRETSPDFYEKFLRNGKVIAIDEGGELRNSFPYLIDILPLPARFGAANNRSLSFLGLPEAVKTERNGRILVTFGGEDPAGLTAEVCSTIVKLYPRLTGKLTVVLGPLYRGYEPDGNVEILRCPASLKELIPRYSGVICSFGLTAYEAVKCGTPVLLVNPTEYHEELTALEEFPSAGVGLQDREKLISFINTPEKYLPKEKDFKGPSLAEYIESLDPPGLSCPVCGNGSYTVIERFPGRTYCRCGECSMLYLLSFEKEKMTYSEEYFFEQYENQYGKTYLDDFSHIMDMGGARLKIVRRLAGKSGSLLDAGCAYGPFLKKASLEGFLPFGTDISRDAGKYVIDTLGFPVEICPFEDFEIPEEWGVASFDIVTMWYVIEHFGNLIPVFTKINKILRIGGIFAFSTPSGSGISAKTDRKAFLKKSPVDHFTVWEKEHSPSIMERFGFKIEKIRVTGHHPERFPRYDRRNRIEKKYLDLYSRVKGLGDTFEIYARKVRDL